MSDPFRTPSLTVNGHTVSLDTDVDLHVGHLSGDMDRVASQMGYWGAVWSAAVEENINVDARYRAWRAQQTKAILADQPSLAEWKVKASIEAHPDFVKFKAAQAIAERNKVMAESAFKSFDKKGNVLQSKGAMARSELDKTGMHTPGKPSKTSPSVRAPATKPAAVPEGEGREVLVKHAPDKSDPRVSAMRDTFKKKT